MDADVVLVGRNPERLERAVSELGALSSAAFDATDFERLERFFDELPTPIDHVLVTAGGPYYARLADIDFEQARRKVDAVFLVPLHIARRAVGKVRPGGTLLFIGGTGGRRPAAGVLIAAFRYGSTLSRPASSTRRCRHRCSAISWTRVASSSARCCRSGAWLVRRTSLRSPSTS